jgi:hypothetical protein
VDLARRKKCDHVLDKKVDKQHRDKKGDRLPAVVKTRNGECDIKYEAIHTSKSSKKRVSSCPELCTHETGQQTDFARLGAVYSHPADYHEERYDKGSDLLTEVCQG